jgi:DNA segregation ATPase FtsK/SpoIIIE, S-DNA-T family
LSLKIEKRKPKKSSAKSKSNDEPKAGHGETPLLLEGIGLFLLSVTLVTVIALLSSFAKHGTDSILGPYLGDWWADTLNQFAGGMPILFLVAAVATLGFKLVLARGGLRVRIVLALSLLFLFAGMMLSIKNLSVANLTSRDYQISGGYLGNFLVQKIFQPLFGQRQFGPYLVTCIAILFTMIWGFRMSVVALSEQSASTIALVLRPFFLGLSRIWEKPARDEDYASDEESGMSTAALARLSTQSKPEPIRKRNTLAERTGPLAGELRLPPTTNKAPVLSEANFFAKAPQETDASMAETDELDLNDPLAVRRSRDEALERKRVSELNDWEVKSRSPEIGGLLLREKAKGHHAEDISEIKDNPKASDPSAAGITEEETLEAVKAAGKKKGKKKLDPEESLVKILPLEKVVKPEPLELVEIEELGESEDSEDSDIDEDAPEALAKAVVKPIPVALVKAVPASPPKPEIKYDTYRIPTVDEIFPDPPKQPLEFTEEELRQQSKVLEDQLDNFKVMGKVTQICPGPVITRYEVELAPGVKVSRISTLADDLALALRAKSIRILAPIPGKSVVGIEVPNRKAQIVYIKEILRAPEFALEEDTLKVGLGKSIGGEPFVMDLTRAPHLLIAGQTGSGKSVCINSIMASFLCSKSPDELRMILIDPKVVELKPYDAIPHLLYPVITQPEVAVQALKWATFEMDRRYETLAQCGVRNIKGFNAKFKGGTLPDSMDDEDKKLMAYIVIIIDELADLMMVAGKEVETNIARIAQKARAVGIHLILATQRPSTNVITGTIKANLPTRIAFQVASQIDARTIMDKMGAEKLLGRGDMLFRPIEFPEPVRLHGCYLDDDQAEKLAEAASKQFVNYPQIQSFNLEDDPENGGESDEPRDEKFRVAAELVVSVKQASVSLLQRRLGIGYARSGRLVDQMERAGIVGRERGSKPREVLMNSEQLESFLSSGLNDD